MTSPLDASIYSVHTGTAQVRLYANSEDRALPTVPKPRQWVLSPQQNASPAAYSVLLLSFSPFYSSPSSTSLLYQQFDHNLPQIRHTFPTLHNSPLVELVHDLFQVPYEHIPHIILQHTLCIAHGIQSTTDGLFVIYDSAPIHSVLSSTPQQQYPEWTQAQLRKLLILNAYYQEIIRLCDMNISTEQLYTSIVHTTKTIEYNQDYPVSTIDFELLVCSILNRGKSDQQPLLQQTFSTNFKSFLPPRSNFQTYMVPALFENFMTTYPIFDPSQAELDTFSATLAPFPTSVLLSISLSRVLCYIIRLYGYCPHGATFLKQHAAIRDHGVDSSRTCQSDSQSADLLKRQRCGEAVAPTNPNLPIQIISQMISTSPSQPLLEQLRTCRCITELEKLADVDSLCREATIDPFYNFLNSALYSFSDEFDINDITCQVRPPTPGSNDNSSSLLNSSANRSIFDFFAVSKQLLTYPNPSHPSLPYAHSTIFNAFDLHDVIHQLHQSPYNTSLPFAPFHILPPPSPSPSISISPSPHHYKLQQYKVTCLGGTFDRLHTGHHSLLLSTALLATNAITLGVTSPTMLTKKAFAHRIEPWDVRVQQIFSYLCLFTGDCSYVSNNNVAYPEQSASIDTGTILTIPQLTQTLLFSTLSQSLSPLRPEIPNGTDTTPVHLHHLISHSHTGPTKFRLLVEPLVDMYGPSITHADLDCLILSKEVEKGGAMVNAEREKVQFSPLDLFVAPLLVTPSATTTIPPDWSSALVQQPSNQLEAVIPHSSDLIFFPTTDLAYKVSSTDFRQLFEIIDTPKPLE